MGIFEMENYQIDMIACALESKIKSIEQSIAEADSYMVKRRLAYALVDYIDMYRWFDDEESD